MLYVEQLKSKLNEPIREYLKVCYKLALLGIVSMITKILFLLKTDILNKRGDGQWSPPFV